MFLIHRICSNHKSEEAARGPLLRCNAIADYSVLQAWIWACRVSQGHRGTNWKELCGQATDDSLDEVFQNSGNSDQKTLAVISKFRLSPGGSDKTKKNKKNIILTPFSNLHACCRSKG